MPHAGAGSAFARRVGGARGQSAGCRTPTRAASGVKNMKVTEKGGPVVAIRKVDESDQVLVTTKSGMMIRTKVAEISVLGRATQGVRVIRLDEGDRGLGVARPRGREAGGGG